MDVHNVTTVIDDVRNGLNAISPGPDAKGRLTKTQKKECKSVLKIIESDIVTSNKTIVDSILDLRHKGLTHMTAIILVEILIRLKKIGKRKSTGLRLRKRVKGGIK